MNDCIHRQIAKFLAETYNTNDVFFVADAMCVLLKILEEREVENPEEQLMKIAKIVTLNNKNNGKK